MSPPLRDGSGSDALRAALDEADAHWRAGRWFEAHEVLETPWRDGLGPRDALQGVLQLAVALHLRSLGRTRAAIALMQRATARLGAPGPAPSLRGVDTAALRSFAEDCAIEWTRAGDCAGLPRPAPALLAGETS